MSILIYAESAEGKFKKVAFELASYAKKVAESLGTTVTAVTVNAEDILEAAEGNGPVSALDAALRKALVNFYPMIAEFQLRDYKVRIIDGGSGTSAKTRVLVESSNGQQRWTTVGVSTNIIDASYQAVVEGLEYGLLLKQQETPVSVVAVI